MDQLWSSKADQLFLRTAVQCNPDLVTLLVCQKSVTKSSGVTK